MRITDVIRVDPEFRAYRKAVTTIETLKRRMEWYRKHIPDRIGPRSEYEYETALAQLQRWVQQDKLPSEAIKWLRQPTKTICEGIFATLPEPKAAQLTGLEQSIADLMVMRGRELAQKQQQFLLSSEMAYRARVGWFMVFNTLTVAPGEYYHVFSKNSTVFKDYIRAVDRAAAQSAYGSVRNAIGHDYHTYFACVEEGAQHGRLHIHCLHFFQKLPYGCTDPNSGRVRPNKRHLELFHSFWSHGKSDPVMVRYSPQDAYGKLGYRWPIDHKTDMPMRVKSPLALATYMSKYVTKGYSSCQRAKLLWRVRKSHNLGQQILNQIVTPLSTSTLALLATTDSLRTKLNNMQVPQSLLRIAALKILQNRHDLQSLPSRKLITLTEAAKLSSPRLSPLQSSRASTQEIRQNNQQNTIIMKTLGLNDRAIFEDGWNELYRSSSKLDRYYFPKRGHIHGTTSVRDHIYTSSKHDGGQTHKPDNRVNGTLTSSTG